MEEKKWFFQGYVVERDVVELENVGGFKRYGPAPQILITLRIASDMGDVLRVEVGSVEVEHLRMLINSISKQGTFKEGTQEEMKEEAK